MLVAARQFKREVQHCPWYCHSYTPLHFWKMLFHLFALFCCVIVHHKGECCILRLFGGTESASPPHIGCHVPLAPSRWRELICTWAFLVIVCVLFCFTTVRILDNTVHYNTSSTTVYNNNQLLSNSTRISFHLFHPRFITRVTINEWFPLRETEGR